MNRFKQNPLLSSIIDFKTIHDSLLGFAAFLPKFLESQINLTPADSSMYLGAVFIVFGALGKFSDASMHLYKRLCPSVGPSVRWSVGPHSAKIAEKG